MFPPAAVPINRLSLREMCVQAGVSSSLEICIDPACAESYPGSGQIVYDLSGKGRHFYLGTNNTVEASDPVFTGTSGALDNTCYFGGGAVGFRAVNANDSFINGLTQPNWNHTIIGLSYWDGTNASAGFVAKSGAVNGTTYGVSVYQPSSGTVRGYLWVAYNGSNFYQNALGINSPTVSPPSNTPFLWGMGSLYTSATNKSFTYYQNGVYQSATDATSWTASSTAASATAMIAETTDGSKMLGTNARFYGMMLFSSYFTQAQFNSLRSLILTRHPGV